MSSVCTPQHLPISSSDIAEHSRLPSGPTAAKRRVPRGTDGLVFGIGFFP